MFSSAGTQMCRESRGGLASVGAIDTRLIAAVQCRAGAQVHEAANLVQTYFYLAEAHKRAARRNDPDAIEAAGRKVRAAVVNLRRFLTSSIADFHASLGGPLD